MSKVLDHPQSNTSKLEIYLRLSTGIFLWLISTTLTVALFMALAGDNIPRQIVMIGTAIGLESAKLLSFRMGKGFRIISLCLIAISILESFGSALFIVESNQAILAKANQIDVRNTDTYKINLTEVESLDSQISILVNRLKSIPDTYITASKDLNVQIETLRSQKSETLKSLFDIKPKVDSSIESPITMFALFSKITTVNENLIILVILMSLSILLDFSIIALTQNHSTSVEYPIETFQPKVSIPKEPVECSSETVEEESPDSLKNEHSEVFPTKPVEDSTFSPSSLPMTFHEAPIEITADAFLAEMAYGMTFPFLRGHNATSEKIGIPYYKAQLLAKQLLKEGKIKVEGKRLIRTGTFHSPIPESKGGN